MASAVGRQGDHRADFGEATELNREDTRCSSTPHGQSIWNDLKAKCKGNYSYKIAWSSWVGSGHETEIAVRDNQVIERRFREWSGQPVPIEPGKTPEPQGETWTEQGEQLGSHEKGAPPKTLDQLYEEAVRVLEEKLEPHHRLYVRFGDRGLLQSCFYVDTRIADDAPQTGVTINSITLDSVEE